MHPYRTIDETLAERQHENGPDENEVTVETVLNELPMVPADFEVEMERLAVHLRSLCDDVDSVVLVPMSVVKNERDVEPSAGRSRRRRQDWKGGRDPADRKKRNDHSITDWIVAESSNDGSMCFNLCDENGQVLGTIRFHPQDGHAFSIGNVSVFQAIANFAAFVLVDLRARCWFMNEHALPSLDDLAAYIIRSSQLTSRDEMVLQLLLRGSSYADAALELNLSTETVKKHMKKLYDRTNSDGLASLFGRFASIHVLREENVLDR